MSEELRCFPGAEQVERIPLAVEERRLTEVDNLNRYRLENGLHSQWVLDQLLDNLIPYVKEGGMPSAVHTVEHLYENTSERDEAGNALKSYMWLGRTAVQNAESGRAFHKHQAALERVAVEVDEARDTEANLRPGITKIFISPRMSEADAPYKVAKAEHLGDDDSLRATTAVTDAQGNIQKRQVQSGLVRDIPLDAWVSFLADPNNPFKKSIVVENPDSALSVMKTHSELEVPTEQLPEGILTIVEAVIPHIKDPDLRASVQEQLTEFREDQQTKHDRAVNIAMRWRDFEVQLADSLRNGLNGRPATEPIRAFINSMQDEWTDKELAVIRTHQLPDAHYRMSRELAAIVEKAQQKTLFVKASVVSGNKRIIDQLDEETAGQIYRAEILTQVAYTSGYRQDILALEAEQARLIGGRRLRGVGGGCAGEIEEELDGKNGSNSSSNKLSGEENKIGKVTRGRCVVRSCPTRPGEVKVGGCGVCLGRCQKLFDKGKDPTRMGSERSQRRPGEVEPSKRQAARRELGHQATRAEQPTPV